MSSVRREGNDTPSSGVSCHTTRSSVEHTGDRFQRPQALFARSQAWWLVAWPHATGVAGGMAELDPPQLVTPTECIDGSLEVSPSTCSAIFAARDVQLTTAVPATLTKKTVSPPLVGRSVSCSSRRQCKVSAKPRHPSPWGSTHPTPWHVRRPSEPRRELLQKMQRSGAISARHKRRCARRPFFRCLSAPPAPQVTPWPTRN